ncbi:hypothetical protein TSUD_369110 [Trifolium subterraneum]|uniref:Uncharacterized protein n=1 Tax=Trifolium subterraneum TaxID=3900 RepID=A0A2Z6PDI1_TRISU|nr:hypothetical protein TSUD_369110 [Trifolium subterraneum]
MDVKKEKEQGNAESSKKKERRIVTWTQEENTVIRVFGTPVARQNIPQASMTNIHSRDLALKHRHSLD